jgi:hypothetical protein
MKEQSKLRDAYMEESIRSIISTGHLGLKANKAGTWREPNRKAYLCVRMSTCTDFKKICSCYEHNIACN